MFLRNMLKDKFVTLLSSKVPSGNLLMSRLGKGRERERERERGGGRR